MWKDATVRKGLNHSDWECFPKDAVLKKKKKKKQEFFSVMSRSYVLGNLAAAKVIVGC